MAYFNPDLAEKDLKYFGDITFSKGNEQFNVYGLNEKLPIPMKKMDVRLIVDYYGNCAFWGRIEDKFLVDFENLQILNIMNCDARYSKFFFSTPGHTNTPPTRDKVYLYFSSQWNIASDEEVNYPHLTSVIWNTYNVLEKYIYKLKKTN